VHVEDDDVLRGIVGDLIDFQSIPCVSFRTNDEAREALTVDNGAITVEIGGAQKKVMVLLLDLLVPGQTTTEELVCCIGRMISSQPIEKVQ
jgi:hypothetical protein